MPDTSVAGVRWSVFLREENSRGGTVPTIIGGFRYDPDLHGLECAIRREHSATVVNGFVVQPLILIVEITPIFGGMAGEKVIRLLATVTQSIKGSGR